MGRVIFVVRIVDAEIVVVGIVAVVTIVGVFSVVAIVVGMVARKRKRGHRVEGEIQIIFETLDVVGVHDVVEGVQRVEREPAIVRNPCAAAAAAISYEGSVSKLHNCPRRGISRCFGPQKCFEHVYHRYDYCTVLARTFADVPYGSLNVARSKRRKKGREAAGCLARRHTLTSTRFNFFPRKTSKEPLQNWGFYNLGKVSIDQFFSSNKVGE